MLSLIFSVLLLVGPVGIDFSTLPAERGQVGFKLWITVHAANGDTFDYGRWGEYGGGTRGDTVGAVEDTLQDGKCQVKRCGDMLVVQTLNGSPVVRVDVKVKDAVGPTPLQTWALRSQPDKPKKEKK